MTRKQILEHLSGDFTPGNYQLLKDCISAGNEVDRWFKGVVNSVKLWQPNTNLLVLCGKDCDNFFKYLLDIEFLYHHSNDDCMQYEVLILNILMRKEVFKIIQDRGFKIGENLNCDKRLCSYCTTWNSKWPFPQRKNVIVVNVEKIDWELYNSINKLELWKEIFKLFA